MVWQARTVQQWGNAEPGAAWGGPGAPVPRRRGSGWAIGAIVAASIGLTSALLGAAIGVLALAGNGLIYAASQGEAGSMRAFVELTRFGNLFVVLPLTVIATACTVLAWRHADRPGRSLATTVVATVLTSVLAAVSLFTALVFI